MQLPRDAILLRIFFGEDDKVNHRPLYEAIVRPLPVSQPALLR